MPIQCKILRLLTSLIPTLCALSGVAWSQQVLEPGSGPSRLAQSKPQDPLHHFTQHPGLRDLHACRLDPRVDESADHARLCRLQPPVYFTEQYLGDETTAQLFDRCGGDSSAAGSEIRYGVFEVCR